MAELARLTAIEPSHTKLPSYEEIQAERELKETFAHLEKDHEDLQELFKKVATDRKSTRLNSSHSGESRMPSSA